MPTLTIAQASNVTTGVRDTGDAILNAFTTALSVLFAFIPRLIGALIILLIGLIVGRVVDALVTRLLRAVKFDQIADRAEIGPFLRNAGVTMDAAAVIGGIAKWFIYLIFFQAAATALGFVQLTVILNDVLAFLPRIVVAIIILLVGALVGNLLAQIVRGSVATARLGNANVLASVARYGVIAFAVVSALSQLEIAPAIVNALWFALIGGTVAAFALAFGLGMRDAAGSIAAGQLIKGEVLPGASLSMGETQGTVEQVGTLYTTVRTANGTTKIPNMELARQTVQVTGGTPQVHSAPTGSAPRVSSGSSTGTSGTGTDDGFVQTRTPAKR